MVFSKVSEKSSNVFVMCVCMYVFIVYCRG